MNADPTVTADANKKYCRDCVYRRTKSRINPFAHIGSWTPELLKAKQDWDHECQEVALREQDRFKSGDDFDFEPSYYDWCAYLTEEGARESVDPVSGEPCPVFILCGRANVNADCGKFRPR